MSRHFPAPQLAGIAALLLFTPFIPWQAKKLERGLFKQEAASSITGESAPEFPVDPLEGRKISFSE